MEPLTYEQRRAIEEAEQDKRNKEFQALVAGILKLMPGWTEREDNPEHPNYRRYVLVKDGMQIHLSRDGQKKDRLNVSTWGWPEYTSWNDRGEASKTTITPRDLWNPKEESPSISVAISRGPDAIVREINRRFLADYERIYQRCLERAIEWGTGQLKSRQNWLAVCEYVGKPPKYNSTHADTKHGRIDIEKRHSDVHIQMDVSLETLKRIINALNSTDEA